jgi:hypothetical protein
MPHAARTCVTILCETSSRGTGIACADVATTNMKASAIYLIILLLQSTPENSRLGLAVFGFGQASSTETLNVAHHDWLRSLSNQTTLAVRLGLSKSRDMSPWLECRPIRIIGGADCPDLDLDQVPGSSRLAGIGPIPMTSCSGSRRAGHRRRPCSPLKDFERRNRGCIFVEQSPAWHSNSRNERLYCLSPLLH